MSTPLENFGRNIRFEARHVLTPRDCGEVVACLDRYRGHKIRVLGSLHSWSEVSVCQDVVLDLRNLNKVALEINDDGSVHAEIEAGCTIDHVLGYLRSHGGYTLPTYSIIGKQTMGGAIATATHGAGLASLSHYVGAVRVAAYDKESGKARTYAWDEGEELRAARCGLGCAGVLLSMRMPATPDYLIEEVTQWFDRIEQVLDQETSYPRQQFYLIPWSWSWFAQLRRPLSRESGAVPSSTARLHRIFRRVGVDVILNGVVRLLSGRLRWWVATQLFYRHVFPLIARSGMRVIDRASHLLMMRHDLYTHVEMELFVPAPHVIHASAFVEWVLRRCGGESTQLPEILSRDDFGRDITDEIDALGGSYVHDHPITFRRVLQDDTLISMTSGGEADAWYAISLITYQRDLAPFLRMSKFIAGTMASAYRARPHWGKICPLDTGELAVLYPALPRFRAHCRSVDPDCVFVNEFVRRALGL